MTRLALTPSMTACINDCNQCHLVCLTMATGYCLEKGGHHIAPEHLRAMLVCAEICRTAAYVLITGSTLHRQMCAVCADMCDACMTSCHDLDGMEECIKACKRCKSSCEEMTSV